MTIIIPDLHGEIDLLERVLAEYPDRQYLFLGDLIDRGSNSPMVVQRVLDLALDNRAILCLGNHEDMWIRGCKYQKEQYFTCWLSNGGMETLTQYQPYGSLMADHIDLIERIAYQWYSLETPHGTALCVHGSVPHPTVFYWADDENHPQSFSKPYDDHLWRGQGDLPHALPKRYEYSVHGHVPRKQAAWKHGTGGKYALLDTNPVKTGNLTVLDTDSLDFITFSRNG